MSVDVDAHMLINDGESVIQAAIAGLGIIQAPHCLAASALEKGLLEIIMTDTISTGSNLWIVYPQKRHLSARVQAFIEWTSELFQRTSEPKCKLVQQQQAELARMRKSQPLEIAAVAQAPPALHKSSYALQALHRAARFTPGSTKGVPDHASHHSLVRPSPPCAASLRRWRSPSPFPQAPVSTSHRSRRTMAGPRPTPARSAGRPPPSPPSRTRSPTEPTRRSPAWSSPTTVAWSTSTTSMAGPPTCSTMSVRRPRA